MKYDDITNALQENTLSEFLVETTACGIQLVHRAMCSALLGCADYSPDRIVYIDIDHRFDAQLLRCLYELSQTYGREKADRPVQERSFVDIFEEKVLVLHPSSYNDICAILHHISSRRKSNDRAAANTEANLTFLVVVDSILSIPHLPYHSNPQQLSPGRPTLKSLFQMLKQLTTRKGICGIGVTNVYAAKLLKYFPYQNGGCTDFVPSGRFGRIPHHSGEADASKSWHCYVYHTDKYPREYKLENEHYIPQRILVKYRHATEVPIGPTDWTTLSPFHPFEGIRLGAQVVPGKRSPCIDTAIIFLSDEEASHLRETFTSRVRMRIGQSPILKNVLVPKARTVEEFHQESYNEIRILGSRFKQEPSASAVHNDASSNAFDALPSSLPQTGALGGHSRPHNDLRPPYHTSAEMMRFIGGY